MKSVLLILVLTIILPYAACGQTAHFAGDGTLVISDGARRIRLPDVSEEIDHCPTAPCVHAILKRHGDYFVVITVSNFTHGYPPRGGGGGCGVESYLKWLHITGDKISESSENLFESWRDNRQGGIDGWHGFLFKVITSDLLEDQVAADEKKEWQDITYTFDAHHPENGIKEEKGAPRE